MMRVSFDTFRGGCDRIRKRQSQARAGASVGRAFSSSTWADESSSPALDISVLRLQDFGRFLIRLGRLNQEQVRRICGMPPTQGCILFGGLSENSGKQRAMISSVTDAGVLLPAELLGRAKRVQIRREENRVISLLCRSEIRSRTRGPVRSTAVSPMLRPTMTCVSTGPGHDLALPWMPSPSSLQPAMAPYSEPPSQRGTVFPALIRAFRFQQHPGAMFVFNRY